jgi:hypothetical protein
MVEVGLACAAHRLTIVNLGSELVVMRFTAAATTVLPLFAVQLGEVRSVRVAIPGE